MTGKRGRTLRERFDEKWLLDPDTGCHLWVASVNNMGYGKLGGKPGENWKLAHRVSWELSKGPIPDGLWVLHKCDTPPCVNEDHLFLGNQTTNMQDCAMKGRHIHGEKSSLSKLTDFKIIEIRRLYASGNHTCRDLADQFLCSPMLISLIVRRKQWKHVK